MIVDGDVEELPTGAVGLIARVAGEAVAGLDDAGEFLDVDVQQVAGRAVFVAHWRRLGLDHGLLFELQAGQDTAYRQQC